MSIRVREILPRDNGAIKNGNELFCTIGLNSNFSTDKHFRWGFGSTPKDLGKNYISLKKCKVWLPQLLSSSFFPWKVLPSTSNKRIWILFNGLHNYKLDTYLDPMPAFCVFKNSSFVILDLTVSRNGSSTPLSTCLSSPARITIFNFAKGRFHIGRRHLTTRAKGFTFPVSPWKIAKYLLLKFSWANESAIIWNQTGDKMLIRNSLFTSFFHNSRINGAEPRQQGESCFCINSSDPSIEYIASETKPKCKIILPNFWQVRQCSVCPLCYIS